MRIIIGGDLVATPSNESLFEAQDITALIGDELKKILDNADYRIYNLEAPFANAPTPIKKSGPALMIKNEAVNGYKALGTDLVSLANNHILDQGESNFTNTLELLTLHDISYVGGGRNAHEARKPTFFAFAGKKVAVYACTQHEFSIARADSPGANPFDALTTFDDIEETRKDSDYLIVLYHAGNEHYRYPSPTLQKICRKMIDKGADLVLCQHSHCVGCEEKYSSGTIVYGQGNFLFDLKDIECWQTGVLVTLDENFTVGYIPVKKTGNSVRLASSDSDAKILGGFLERSAQIKSPDFVSKEFNKFAMQNLYSYLSMIAIPKKNILYRIINKLSGHRFFRFLIRRKYNTLGYLTLKNLLQCEAHNETILAGLEQQINMMIP